MIHSLICFPRACNFLYSLPSAPQNAQPRQTTSPSATVTWARPESPTVLMRHLSRPSQNTKTKHQRVIKHYRIVYEQRVSCNDTVLDFLRRKTIHLQMNNPMQAHNPPFLRDQLSKQAPVPGTAAVVKRYKMLDPEEHFSHCFLCMPPFLWHRHHASDAFEGRTDHFKNTNALTFLSASLSIQLRWILHNTLGKSILNTLKNTSTIYFNICKD